MMTDTWTAEEASLLRALALQTPCLSFGQIIRGWFAKSDAAEDTAEQILTRLVDAQLIEEQTIEAHPLQALTKPLFAWRPGESSPTERRLATLAERAKDRWQSVYVSISVFVASPKTIRSFGAFHDVRQTKHCEATHNLHLGEVLVRYRTAQPRLAATWWGEAAFPKLGFDIKGMKDPDAFLLDPLGRAVRIVEFVGSYPAEHLLKFHEHCAGEAAQRMNRFLGPRFQSGLGHLYASTGTAYELW
jgi:hypothetical protein